MPLLAQKSKIKEGRTTEKSPVKSGKDKIKSQGMSVTDSLAAENEAVEIPSIAVEDSIIEKSVEPAEPKIRYYTAVRENQLLAMESWAALVRTRYEKAEKELDERFQKFEAAASDADPEEDLVAAKVKLVLAGKRLAEADIRLGMVRSKLVDLGRIGDEKDIDLMEDSQGDNPEIGGGKGKIKGDSGEKSTSNGKGKGAVKRQNKKKAKKDRKRKKENREKTKD